MICPQCKKQIPDDSQECGYCGSPINHQEQVSQEISYRRYQRWFFYGVIILIFLGMVAITVRMYNVNSNKVAELATMREKMEKKREELSSAKQNLSEKEEELQQTKSNLSEKEQQLQKKKEELQEEMNSKAEIEERYQDCNMDMNQADSNIYRMIVNIGEGVETEKLNQIPLADVNLEGEDQDGDGLSDVLERSLPTDPAKADTDGDGFNDKEELLRGFNPVGGGKLATDQEFIEKQKGEILLQVEGNNEAWYVTKEGKRMFLGTPADAFEVIKSVDYWSESASTSTPTSTDSASGNK